MDRKPVIKGTRLTVDYILNLLAHVATVAEILEEYERLTPEEVRACLLVAANVPAGISFAALREMI